MKPKNSRGMRCAEGDQSATGFFDAEREALVPLTSPHRPSRNARFAKAAPELVWLGDVSVVIPTLNEAANLTHVLSELPAGLREVILVDGGSTDNTKEVARELVPGLRILDQEGKGKGDALRCGFEACTGAVIVMLDADGSTDPAEIPRFVQAIRDGADFAKGSRFLPDGGSADLTRWRRFGNTVLCGVVNVLYGTKYTDLCYGYNAFRTSCLEKLVIDCPGFEVETLINVRIAKLDFRVAEVASFESERIHGESKLHPVRDGIRVLRTVVRERVHGLPTSFEGGALVALPPPATHEEGRIEAEDESITSAAP